MPKNKIVLYESESGRVELARDIQGNTLWATQDQISQLFNVSIPNINIHLKNIFDSGELNKGSVIKKSLITAKDGKQYRTYLYHLDVTIAVGYRVNSKKATQFRIWATNILRSHILKIQPANLATLHEAIDLINTKPSKGKTKTNITLKVSKDLI